MAEGRGGMDRVVRRFAERIAGIRGGTIGVGFVESFAIRRGGLATTIGRVASVGRRGDQILISPFDPADVPAVAKAFAEAKVGAYAVDPRTVAVPIPPISGEQKAEMARHVRSLAEEAKVAIRGLRQEARKATVARGRHPGRGIQEATDAAIGEVDRLAKAKIAEIGA